MNNEKVTRVSVPAIDEILGKEFKVGPDGFVRVMEYMGSDESIVRAARISYGTGTRHVSKDRDLIRYLTRHKHTSPFEMAEILFHVRVPMDIWRQWIRHRTANVNEYSTRYSEAISSTAYTSPGEWRTQSSTNNQGSGELLNTDIGSVLTNAELELHRQSREVYSSRLEAGVAREQARKDLPLSTYTEAFWKIDLRNLLHFLSLRMEEHAQKEIRDFAITIGNEIVKKWVPLAWEAFADYEFNATVMSALCKEIVKLVVAGNLSQVMIIAQSNKIISLNANGDMKVGREAKEIAETLKELGLGAPWNINMSKNSQIL